MRFGFGCAAFLNLRQTPRHEVINWGKKDGGGRKSEKKHGWVNLAGSVRSHRALMS